MNKQQAKRDYYLTEHVKSKINCSGCKVYTAQHWLLGATDHKNYNCISKTLSVVRDSSSEFRQVLETFSDINSSPIKERTTYKRIRIDARNGFK